MGSLVYEVTCRCGRALRGERGRRHQVVPCPVCGRGVFVLPGRPVAEAPAPGRSRWWAWRWPVLAGGVCLAAVIVAYVFTLPYLTRGPEKRRLPPDPAALRAHIDTGKKALAGGSFRVALRELNLAVALRDRQPDLLAPAEHRALNQAQRQADLLARLSHLTLEEIVARGKVVRHAYEWDEQFADFRGRGVIFDDALRRDAEGRPVLVNQVVEVGDEQVRLALEDLTALQDVPLGDEPRVIFGAKLHSCSREQGGEWVVRFERDSGVLFTDAEAVEACFPVAAGEELKGVMARQGRWLEARPMAAAVRSTPVVLPRDPGLK